MCEMCVPELPPAGEVVVDLGTSVCEFGRRDFLHGLHVTLAIIKLCAVYFTTGFSKWLISGRFGALAATSGKAGVKKPRRSQ
jgi:hypothetical protein